MASLGKSKKLLLLLLSTLVAPGSAELVAHLYLRWDHEAVAIDLARRRNEVVGRWDGIDVGDPVEAKDPDSKAPSWVTSPYCGFDYDHAREDHGMDLARVFVARERLLAGIDAALESPLLASAVPGELCMRRIQGLHRAFVSANDVVSFGEEGRKRVIPACTGPPMGERFDALEACVGIWRDSSLSLHAICEAHGIRYLHVLQPARHDEGSKRLTETELSTATCSKTWETATRLGHPKLRVAGEELREAGAASYDESGVFEDTDETLYFDVVHFNRSGHRLVAAAIAGHLRAELE